MPDLNPIHWWQSFLALPNDSRLKTFLVAFLVASVSAASVSVTAVSLRPLQHQNVERQRQEQLQAMLASVPGLTEIMIEVGESALETRIVDLKRGTFVDDVDLATFDAEAVAADPASSTALPAADDIARIGRRPDLAPVHLVRQDDELLLLVMPIFGSGYLSTIRAYLALESDLNTIAALSIYEQGETPGLGARIAESAWQSNWVGRPAADETGTIRVGVGRGGGDEFEVDGITGATQSTTGVTNLVRFWLGEDGFGPFLTNLREGSF